MAEIDIQLVAPEIRLRDFRQVDFWRSNQRMVEGGVLRDGVPLVVVELAGLAIDVDVSLGLDVLVGLDAAGLGTPLELYGLVKGERFVQ